MTIPAVAMLVLLSRPAPVPEGAAVSGSFITTLGQETVAVESYTRTADRLEGDILLRVPGTTRYHYRLSFAKDGSVKTSEFTIKPLGAKQVDEARRLTIDFGRDTMRLISFVRGETQIVERPGEGSANVLFLGGYASSHGLYGSFGMYEHVLQRLEPGGTEVVSIQTIAPDTAKASTRRFKPVSPGVVDIDFFKMAWMRVNLDASGLILSADATATTERTLTKRIPFLDIEPLEKEYLSLDKAGRGIGEASPNVETKTTLGGVTIVLKYGSPRLRGRTGVLKALISSGAVWRTGANEATTIEFDRDLRFGGSRLKAGRYSLWTFATSSNIELIVNKETGQWGTTYKKTQDLLRLPLETRSVEPPLENFTIRVVEGRTGGELRIEWDTFAWCLPLSVPPAP